MSLWPCAGRREWRPFSREGRDPSSAHSTGTASHSAPLLYSAHPRADAENHPISVLPNLDASAGQRSNRGGTWVDQPNTSPVPKGTSPCCLDTLMLHREGRHGQGLLRRQILANTKDAKFGLKAAQCHPPGYYWIWDSNQFHSCVLRPMAGAQLAEISQWQDWGEALSVLPTQTQISAPALTVQLMPGSSWLSSAQPPPVLPSGDGFTYPHWLWAQKGRSDPSLCPSSFMAHLPATVVSVSQLPALPQPLLWVDKRLSLGMTCWETEGTSSARVYGMVVSAVGKK